MARTSFAAMHIYFMGVCGTAMGNAALLMREAGHRVSGSDSGVYPPMSTTLADAGVDVLEGYDPERLRQLSPDLVVIGNAQSRGNPEVEWLLETRALPFCSLPGLLSETVLSKRRNIVVAGTHGKTTTTALAASILRSMGLDAGWIVGGVPRDLPAGYRLGDASAPFVIEGDEYDSAFFDKRSKFIHYCPHVLIINNIEFDHADIFRDLAEVQRTFNHVLRIVPRNGWVLVNADDENISPLLPAPWTQVLSVGLAGTADLRISDFHDGEEGSSFTLSWRGESRRIQSGLNGLYNARNATMALLASWLTTEPRGGEGSPLGIDLPVLAAFQGVKRRQEVRVRTEQLVVVEDFGHHPTAIRATLEGLRSRFPKCRIAAAFEPRSNTAATNVFQYEFTEALGVADMVFLGPIHRAEKIPAHLRLDTSAMAGELSAAGRLAVAAKSNDEVLNGLLALSNAVADRLLVCFFSNGAFGGIIQEFAARAVAKTAPVD